MAVNFIVEDGTGKTDSTSYADVAGFRQYYENIGTSFSETDSEIETWLNEATLYADTTISWGGIRLTEEQALEVPRSDWYNCSGTDLSESVPIALKNGIYELAYVRQGSDSIDIGATYNGQVKSEAIGKTNYTYSNGFDYGGLTLYPNANRWFKQLCNNSGLGRVCRT